MWLICHFFWESVPCQPEAFMLDFESAAWGAIRTCFAGAKIYGRGFHWASYLQNKWNRIQAGDFRRRLARTTIRNNEAIGALWTTYEQDPTKKLSDVLDSLAALFGY